MQSCLSRITLSSFLWLLGSFGLAGCVATPTEPVSQTAEVGDDYAIVVCGERFSTHGAPVVLWDERGGFNAYNTHNHFPNTPMKSGKRYTPGRQQKLENGERKQLVPASAQHSEDLAGVVDQFVLHYDVCGASERCFMVLHDDRELSVQFLLDVDGTIYQTMDVRDQAWHAGVANTRSVGVEIAQIGAYPEGATGPLEAWYEKDALGAYVSLDRLEPWNIRTAGFVARPRKPDLQKGLIHGTEYEQYDFTPEQYDSLVKLTAALSEALPNLKLDAPRDRTGEVRSDKLSHSEYDAFQGILGHYHVSGNKRDPGPAFDWERYLRAVRHEVARP